MIVGVPLLNQRVAPRCTSADHLLIVTLRREHVISHHAVPVEIRSPIVLLGVLQNHGIGTLVCGGISREARETLQTQSISVVDNVACSAAEVMSALEAGSLCPDFGLGAPVQALPGGAQPAGAEERPAVAVPAMALPDCLACIDRVCLRGEPCRISQGFDGTVPESSEVRRMLSASADVAFESERQLCRLSELVYFCLEMEYSRIGIAFCTDLLEPAGILARVLRRFFTVAPVCCAVGGALRADTASELSSAASCNPLQQARVLNEVGTDINVLVGLCIGADCVFAAASEAPVTTLFVKDRSLANNPIGAVYSEYHLRESAGFRGSRGTGDGLGRCGSQATPTPAATRSREAL